MPNIVMPRLSDSMEEGTVLTWIKKVGEEVAVGDELVEIETDKANMTYEADLSGTLTEILVEEGETVAIGSPIASIGEPSEASPPRPEPAPLESAASQAPPAVLVAAPTAGDGRRNASPLARRLAQDLGIDLDGLVGSGPTGRIVKKDVESAGAAGASTPAPETAKGRVAQQELTKLQQVVARRMSESKATAPHFYLSAQINMSEAVAARARMKAASAGAEPVPSFNDMVVKACALALRRFPKVNGSHSDGRFELYSRVNVGIAVAAEDALVVPTIFDADQKGLGRIAAESRELAQLVRDGKVAPPQLAGGTFTISNLGMFGVDRFNAVINPGQAAILAVGAITERPVVRDGAIVPGHILEATLACDHRILYGAEGAEFLSAVKAMLEEPLALAL